MKTCTRCLVEKPFEAFGKRAGDKFRSRCRQCSSEQANAWRRQNLATQAATARAWREANPERHKATKARHANTDARRERPREKYQSEAAKAWRVQYAERKNARLRERRQTDPHFAMAARLRCRINEALRGRKKCAPLWTLTGCDRDQLIAHIESKFQDGMTWENRSAWHVDHIKPCALFDLTDPAEQKKCFHFTNLQPLWSRDNISKGAKYAD